MDDERTVRLLDVLRADPRPRVLFANVGDCLRREHDIAFGKGGFKPFVQSLAKRGLVRIDDENPGSGCEMVALTHLGRARLGLDPGQPAWQPPVPEPHQPAPKPFVTTRSAAYAQSRALVGGSSHSVQAPGRIPQPSTFVGQIAAPSTTTAHSAAPEPTRPAARPPRPSSVCSISSETEDVCKGPLTSISPSLSPTTVRVGLCARC